LCAFVPSSQVHLKELYAPRLTGPGQVFQTKVRGRKPNMDQSAVSKVTSPVSTPN